MNNNQGQLYIVSTPIGNLDDITFRAINTLKMVDIVAAEDTRRTRELLNHFDIKTKTISCNEFSSESKISYLISELLNGKNIAVVSDAGTPIISDPGALLIKEAIKNNINIVGIPGACAAINAIVLSGIDSRKFTFVGFLSEDNKKRKMQIDDLKLTTGAIVFYISSHNLKKDIKTLIDEYGEDAIASLSREMTKKFEETVRGTLSDIYKYLNDKEIRGEFVLVLEGITQKNKRAMEKEKWLQMDINSHLKYYLDTGISEKEALKKIASDRDVSKSEIYKLLKVK